MDVALFQFADQTIYKVQLLTEKTAGRQEFHRAQGPERVVDNGGNATNCQGFLGMRFRCLYTPWNSN